MITAPRTSAHIVTVLLFLFVQSYYQAGTYGRRMEILSFQELESEAFFCAVPHTQTHLRHFNARFSFSYFGSFPRMLFRSLRESGRISKTGLVPDEHISCAFLASLL
jgi:hypothetical protein